MAFGVFFFAIFTIESIIQNPTRYKYLSIAGYDFQVQIITLSTITVSRTRFNIKPHNFVKYQYCQQNATY